MAMNEPACYKLFIDDERFPLDTRSVVVRSSKEAIDYVKLQGVPCHIDFDHDLGGEDTSMVFINWFIEMLLDGEVKLPVSFTYAVHSQNPVGVNNIKSKMDGIINYLKN